MTTEQATLFAIFAAVLILMIWGRWRYDLVAFAGLIAGVLAGIVPAEDAFSGFANPATMTVALILVVTAGLQRSGVVAMLTRLLSGAKRPVPVHIAIMGTVGAAISGFMNNVAALAILMPIDIQTARRAKRSAALTLMPLAFATILGGMTTMIGTPPNLIVSQFRRNETGEAFQMFDFLPVGGTVAIAGVCFIALIGWRLLPRRDENDSGADSREKLRDYVAQLVLPEASSAVGKSLGEIVESTGEVVILAVEREGTRYYRTSRMIVLHAGDRLIIEASPDAIEDFRTDLGLAYPETETESDEDTAEDRSARLDAGGRVLVEAVVPLRSRLIGRRADHLFRGHEVDGMLLGILREGQTLREKLNTKRVRHGDVLLLLLPEESMAAALDPRELMPLEGGATQVTKESRLWAALAIFTAAITLTSLGLITMPIALGVVIVLYVLGGILSLEDIYDHIDWPIIVLLGAMIPLGLAFETSGGSALIASGLESVTSGFPPWVALALLMVATMCMSDILNNNATTILAAPVSIDLANQIGVNSDAFLMGVAVSAACAFLTPIGHQNNTLILGPGGYRFSDYWRMGLPLEIIVILVSVPMLLITFPL
ncbi:SLC13 family permease [Paracoccus aurantiacus]|uniref:SLC13 family permease n=1 Tax=Paracoccus aurantiacus TaxID=2599412 RepID=A0A5C6S8F7_9RHOB|nr:SLC13 family permease [Paracoccus aurantiacus]TXB70042.1 SLC13 family permease [Paracoccus aurantiacus]